MLIGIGGSGWSTLIVFFTNKPTSTATRETVPQKEQTIHFMVTNSSTEPAISTTMKETVRLKEKTIHLIVTNSSAELG